MAEVSPEDIAAVRERRVRTSHLVAGALLECAGVLRRARWALGPALTKSSQSYLDEVSAELFSKAMSAEVEAEGLASGDIDPVSKP